MVGWHHRLNGHEFEQVLVVGDGQGRLACYSPWCCKESDMTEWINWTELIQFYMQQYIVLLPTCILLFKWMTSLFIVSATCFPPLPYYLALGFWPPIHVEVCRPVSLFHHVYITFPVHHWWIFKFFPVFHYFLPGCNKDSCASPFVHKQLRKYTQ